MPGRAGIVCALIVLSACGDADSTAPNAADLVLNFQEIMLNQLDSVQILPSFIDTQGALISGIRATFVSSAPTLVAVSNVGVVRSLGHAGSATITVRGGGLSRVVPVMVEQVAVRIAVTPNPGALPQKGTLQINAQLLDRVDQPIPNAPMIYESSHPAIATVSGFGLVTSVGPAGTSTISIRSGAFGIAVQVAVTQVATRIQVFGASPLRIALGRSVKLAVFVLDAVDVAMAGHLLRFTSLDPAVISVSQEGIVTSIGPLGAASLRIEVLGTTLVTTLPLAVVTAASPLGTAVDTVRVLNGFAVAITSTSAFVVNPYGVEAAAIDLQSRTFVRWPNATYVLDIAVSRDHRFAYLATTPGMRRIDLTTGEVRDFEVGLRGTAIALAPDGRVAYLGTEDGFFVVIDVVAWQLIERVPITVRALHISIDGSGRYAYLSGDGNVQELDLTRRAIARTFPVVRGQGTALAPDGRTLYVGTENGAVVTIDLLSGSVSLFKAMPDCGSWGIAVTPDDRYLYLACAGQHRIDVMDTQSRMVLRQYRNFGEPRRFAVSDDGSIVAVSTLNGTLIFR